ncbi:MAG: energy transducer TonB [Candidatus Cloacimonetes bacterium]|nr:energy transducer TonB [Candidatus Cloacimonadota bacterium]
MDKNETGSILEAKKLLSCLLLSLLLHVLVFTLHKLSLRQPASHEPKLSSPSIQVSLISEIKSTTKPEPEPEPEPEHEPELKPEIEPQPEAEPEAEPESEPEPEPEPEQRILEPVPAIKPPSKKPAPKIINPVVPKISYSKIKATPAPAHEAIIKLSTNEHRLLKRAILSCQKYPESLRRRNLQGAVHLTFELDENQKLGTWEVLSNKGHPDFIDASHKTLQCLAANNPLKRKVPKITVNLEFKLR